MFSSSITLRRFLLPKVQTLKPLAISWRAQKTQASPLKNSETLEGTGQRYIEGHVHNGVRPFEDIPGPSALKYLLEFYRVSEGFTKGYRLLDIFFGKYGPIYKENVLIQGAQTVHVIDPDDFERVFRAEGKYPQRPPIDIWVEQRKRLNYFPGVFSSDGEEWKRIRQSIAPKVMRPKIVEENIDNFNAVADDAIARFVKLNEVSDDHLPDLKGEVSRWSTESIGTVAFDIRLGLYEDPPSREALRFIGEVQNFFKFSHKLLFSVASRFVRQYVDTPTLKMLWKSGDAILEIGQGFVDRKMKELKEMADKGIDPSNNTQVVSVLTYLLTRRDLTPEEVNGHAIDVVIGGVDTTSLSALWFLYNLARFPEVQEKLYQEVDSVVGKSDVVTSENLTRLPYLKACLKESIRLTPVVNAISRILDQDVVLSGYNVADMRTNGVALHSALRKILQRSIGNETRAMVERKQRRKPRLFCSAIWIRDSYVPRSSIG